jgi:protein-ribulosamine 3-kinase
MIPEPVTDWLESQGYGSIVASRTVGGGCINHGMRIETVSGDTFFIKTNRSTPEDMFAREAEGLQALWMGDGPRVPRPYHYGGDYILLEDLKPAARERGYWEKFGRQMARLHQNTKSQFGFEHDNYIGSTPQPNPWVEDGHEFFAEHRLMFQADLAGERGLLSKAEVGRVERLAQRIKDYVPEQPASLIHGDLWSGNATTDERGRPAIIDPAAHYGWAEAELAMTALFGAFSHSFYRAYDETRPLKAGYQERFPLYNLYHLLNHLNLFGGGYYEQVMSIVRRYV